MEKRINKMKERLSSKLDLSREVIMDLPQITVTGNNEITIENHKGIILFEDREVKINSNVGLISIYGKEFEILFMGGSTLTLSGTFRSIKYEGNA